MQRRSEAPVSDCPWEIDSERSRGYNQKDRGTENGAGAFHARHLGLR